ncbi:MAG: Nif3-like dinuclear metal center hexameric protein [Desulfobulbaceae bacterium]|nr:Nif3-like dinuclear metal center hexameric protein [Desulfobulbaceae bacterium]
MTDSAVLDVRTLVAVLDELAAFSLAESWDNVGLMAGDPAQRVRAIMVALDPTEEVLDEAVANGCNVLVTHHPLIFKPLKSLRTDELVGRLLMRAMVAGIAVIACHTNLDLAGGGVNDVLARRLGLRDARPLGGDVGDGGGFGRIGSLPEPVPGQEMLVRIAQLLGVAALAYAGPLPSVVSMLGVCGGSGSELATDMHRLGAQMYVTGEVKHSTARWAEAVGFCVVDGGHFATENPVVPEFAALVQRTLAGRGLAIAVRAATAQGNPFTHFFAG